MKFPLAKTRNSNDALESALRRSALATAFPPNLHRSIMRAVRANRPQERPQLSLLLLFRQFALTRVVAVIGVATLIVMGFWLALRNRPQSTMSNSQSLTEISTAFTASQEIVDNLPSTAVGPLSEELDKVNQDLNRTTDFLLATLP